MTDKKRFDDLAKDYALDELAFPDGEMLQVDVRDIVVYYYESNRKTIFGDPLKILDIGCGTGITSKEIISATVNIELLLLDESPAMIAQAKKNLAGDLSRIKSYRFIEADIGEYFSRGIEDKFDIIVSAQTLHNIEKEKRDKILKDIYRNLNYKGLFINADIVYSSDLKYRGLEFDYMVKCVNKYAELGRPDLQQKWLEHIKEDFSPNRIIIEKEFFNDMERAGFRKCTRGPIDLPQDRRNHQPYMIFTGKKLW